MCKVLLVFQADSYRTVAVVDFIELTSNLFSDGHGQAGRTESCREPPAVISPNVDHHPSDFLSLKLLKIFALVILSILIHLKLCTQQRTIFPGRFARKQKMFLAPKRQDGCPTTICQEVLLLLNRSHCDSCSLTPIVALVLHKFTFCPFICIK